MRATTLVLSMLLVGLEGTAISLGGNQPETSGQLGPPRDEIGEGRTQGYLTHLRAALEMARPLRARPWYELSHPRRT